MSAICQMGFRDELGDDRLLSLISFSVVMVYMCMNRHNLFGRVSRLLEFGDVFSNKMDKWDQMGIIHFVF